MASNHDKRLEQDVELHECKLNLQVKQDIAASAIEEVAVDWIGKVGACVQHLWGQSFWKIEETGTAWHLTQACKTAADHEVEYEYIKEDHCTGDNQTKIWIWDNVSHLKKHTELGKAYI